MSEGRTKKVPTPDETAHKMLSAASASSSALKIADLARLATSSFRLVAIALEVELVWPANFPVGRTDRHGRVLEWREENKFGEVNTSHSSRRYAALCRLHHAEASSSSRSVAIIQLCRRAVVVDQVPSHAAWRRNDQIQYETSPA